MNNDTQVVKKNFGKKLAAHIWPSADEFLYTLTDEQINKIATVRHYMQTVGAGLVGERYMVYFGWDKLAFIALGSGDLTGEYYGDLQNLTAVFSMDFNFDNEFLVVKASKYCKLSHSFYRIDDLEQYDVSAIGNGETTQEGIEREERESNEWLAKFEEKQAQQKPTTESRTGVTELFNLEASGRHEAYGILNDANHLIRYIEEDAELLRYVKQNVTKDIAVYDFRENMSITLRNRYDSYCKKSDTDGHNGYSFSFVIANALWRIGGFVDTLGDVIKDTAL